MRRRLYMYVGLILFVYVQTIYAQEACQTTIPPRCDLYNNCIDYNCKCANTAFNYSAAFGPKYCGRFKQNSKFSKAGRAWRDKTLRCLADKASQAYVAQQSPSCNCEVLQNAMISSHTECYVSAPSFCDLSDSDLKVVARIVDAKDFLSLGMKGVTEVGRTLYACATQAQKERAVHVARVFVAETLTEGTEEARNYAKQVLDTTAEEAEKAGLKEFASEIRKLREELIPDVIIP